jgi:hypothetical protein
MKSSETFNLNIQTPESGDNDEISQLKAEMMSYKPLIDDAIKRQNLKEAEALFAKAKELKERLTELREQRKNPNYTPELDKFKPEQIAKGISEVSNKTIIYIGEWNPEVFQTIKEFPNIKYLYESYPDNKIFLYELKTHPTIQTSEQARLKLEEKGILVSDYGKDLLDKTEYSKEQQEYNLVQFTVGQLGFPDGATTDQIYARALELGLKLCPPEVGPQLRLVYEGKDWKIVAMKQITDRDGGPFVFSLDSVDAKLELRVNGASPGGRSSSVGPFVFLAS